MGRNWFTAAIVCLLGFMSAAFAKEWVIDTTTTATTLVGAGIAGKDAASAAAALNGVGAIVDVYNGTAWTKTGVTGGLLLDSDIGNNGLVVATSMWFVFISQDGGNTFTTVPGVSGISQSANVFGENSDSIGLVGAFAVTVPDSKLPVAVNGVAYSHDRGQTWAFSSDVPSGSVRYGAYPSKDTWYVSSGMWADDSVKSPRALSSRLSIAEDHSRIIQSEALFAKKRSSSKLSETGYFGAVSKTTDGGKTWTEVFHTDLENDYFYFNEIACSTVDNCVVVGEGEDGLGGYLNVAYTTTDGGAHWERSLTATDVSMVGVSALAGGEFWAAATRKDGRNLIAQFYHSTDNGKTFAIEQTLKNCFIIDLDFSADGYGIGACSSSSGSSCFAALYR